MIKKKIKDDQKEKKERKYKNLSEDEIIKKAEYGCERYKNLSEYSKQKLIEYRKTY